MAEEVDRYEPLYEPPKPCADKIFWGTLTVVLSLVLAAFGFGAVVYIVMLPAVIVFVAGFIMLMSGISRAAYTIDMLGKQLLVDPREKRPQE